MVHDKTSWDADNLLGRYHLWRIKSKYPIPGSVVLNDYRRRGRGVTMDALDREVAAMKKREEDRLRIETCVQGCVGGVGGGGMGGGVWVRGLGFGVVCVVD